MSVDTCAVLKERESSRILSSFENELGELNIQIDRLDKAVHSIIPYQPEKTQGSEIEKAKVKADLFINQVHERISSLRSLNAKLRVIANDLETF